MRDSEYVSALHPSPRFPEGITIAMWALTSAEARLGGAIIGEKTIYLEPRPNRLAKWQSLTANSLPIDSSVKSGAGIP
jgi:hypothetical protein